ncbi:hypothetical protein SAMN05428642_1021039 [Flaviramulus basaltis]|uniref:Insecticidal toxin complex protein n=2 Tax=Flaviramulus basaltis TaxID=369401 RepID=A0A1K2IKM1_9FLAO|nr:hypothetical protein SAMN05428642_1021039 [Flaviramulus basaltis]
MYFYLMIRWIVFLFLFMLNNTLYAKEWESLKAYQKITQKENLSPSDWLKRDRNENTLVWKEANIFNLKNNLPKEYTSIIQRRDFYKWLYSEISNKGHEILWINMAYFISKKMHLMEVFPYSIFSKRKIKTYAREGSETVFNNAFAELNKLYNSKFILKEEKALEWDKSILKKEQYIWIDSVYKKMDAKSFKTLESIARGEFLYGLLVPKSIRFNGDLSNAESRYQYAINKLKPYCENALP